MQLTFSYIATTGKKIPVAYQLPENTSMEEARAQLERVRAWYAKNGSRVVDARIVT